MIIPDINLLLYAYDGHSRFRPEAAQWWAGLMNDTAPVGLTWAVILGFLRLATSPRVYQQPATVDQALGFVNSWLARPHVRLLQPGPGHREILFRFLSETGVAGNLTTDAHIAAIAVEFNAYLHSNDTDFRRFPGVRLINPLA